MPSVYGFSDAGTAKALAALVGGDSYEKSEIKTKPSFNIQVKITTAIPAWNKTSLPSSNLAQRLSINTVGRSEISYHTGGTLPLITVHNLLTVPLPVDAVCNCVFMDGRWFVISMEYFKSLVRFTLNSALTTSDASKTATITNQYGPGVDNTTASGGITVHNLETSSAGTFVFEGNSGDAGLAMWDETTNYRIIQIECPNTTGGGDGGGGDGGGGSSSSGGTP